MEQQRRSFREKRPTIRVLRVPSVEVEPGLPLMRGALVLSAALVVLPIRAESQEAPALAGQQASDSADMVTEHLFRQYVVGRGKIPTSHVNAAIELVAARGRSESFIRIVLAEFEKSCKTDNSRTIRRNLLALMSKMLAVEGGQRWRYERARRTGEVELSATTVTPMPSPENDKIVYRESEMLARVIARGRQADRHDIDAFVIAVRQAHHPQGKPFLLDVLRNPPDPLSAELQTGTVGAPNARGKWPDNVGGSWLDAKFHAAVGLAELGEHAGVEWLIRQSEQNEFGVGSMSASLNHAPHREVTRSNLRESCIHALADLSGLPPTDESAQWKAWWAANKDDFAPNPVALQID